MDFFTVLTSPSRPWQNPSAERLVGSIRRECLDHVIVLGERHLRRLLTAYLLYYHGARTHLALEKDAPTTRRVQTPTEGHVVAFPAVGGLPHRVNGLDVEDVDISQVVHVRRSVWKGQDLAPKTENAIREVDIDETLTVKVESYRESRRAVTVSRPAGIVVSHNDPGDSRGRLRGPLLEWADYLLQSGRPSRLRGRPPGTSATTNVMPISARL